MPSKGVPAGTVESKPRAICELAFPHVRVDGRGSLGLRRLYADIRIEAKEILASRKLLGIFPEQFAVRMNTKKRCDQESIAVALMDIAG